MGLFNEITAALRAAEAKQRLESSSAPQHVHIQPAPPQQPGYGHHYALQPHAYPPHAHPASTSAAEPYYQPVEQAPYQAAPLPQPHVPHAQPKALPQKINRWLTAAIAATAALVLCSVGLVIAMIITTIAIPNPMVLRKEERAPVIRVVGADGALLQERGQAYDYMPIDFLPPHVAEAVIATEDHRFYDHWGLDPIGMMRAALTNLRAGRYAQGGSTLTQQLAKNLFLSSERRLGRKVEELYLALWLELRLTKKDILELYLNRVYFGGGAYGIEAAARRYFNKTARELTLMEAAVLGGVLKAPSKYSPLSNPTLALARAQVVLQKMLTAGHINEEQAKSASSTPISFQGQIGGRELTGLESAIDFALERLPSMASGSSTEIIVQTTLDGRLQKLAQQKLAQMIAAEGEASQVSQGAIVLLDPDGGIKAIVGGKNYGESQFNRAAKARRQPGSTFKPFVYLAALEGGLTPDTTVFDLPLSVKGWSPRNENGTFKGAMSLRQGLAQSVNSIAVRLHLDVGVKKTVDVANRLGVRSELRDGPALALGTSEVTLLELTGAYGAFASGGYKMEPHIVERVSTSGGTVLYQRQQRSPMRVIGPAQVGQMNDMLNAALVNGTGRRAALDRHPAAGKTGTSQDFRDAWFVGYTSHFVGGVWFGNDNGQAMNKIMGGSMPARLWHEVMMAAHQGRDTRALPGTSTVAPVQTPPPQPPASAAAKPAIDPPRPVLVQRRPVQAAPAAPQAAANKRPAEAFDPADIAARIARSGAQAEQPASSAREKGMMSLGHPLSQPAQQQ